MYRKKYLNLKDPNIFLQSDPAIFSYIKLAKFEEEEEEEEEDINYRLVMLNNWFMFRVNKHALARRKTKNTKS